MVEFFRADQEQDVKRRRRQAQMLMEMGKPQQTQMVGNVAVVQSPFEQLARGLSTGLGAYQEARADTDEAEIAQRRADLIKMAGEKITGGDLSAASGMLMQDPTLAQTGINLAGKQADIEMRRQQMAEMAAYRNALLGLQQQRLNDSNTGKPPSGYRWNAGGTALEPIPGGPAAGGGMMIGDDGEIVPMPNGPVKPLPVGALKEKNEIQDQLALARNIEADLGGFTKQIDEGKLQLGPIANKVNALQNFAGMSDEESRAYGSFQSTLERLRNDSLRLNKGVQTEGDAQRAWNELISNINDPQLVKQRLVEIQQINNRVAELKRFQLGELMQNYGRTSNIPSQINNPVSPYAPAGTVPVGTVEDGYRFKGGDPANPNSWEPVQ